MRFLFPPRHWWEDHQYLKSYNVECMRLISADAIVFRLVNNRYNPTWMPSKSPEITIGMHELIYKKYSLDDILSQLHLYDTSRSDYRHAGPTNEELNHPGIKAAWDEIVLLRKLLGTHDKI